MRLTLFPYLLVLLLGFAWSDNILAALTPETEDDIAAEANDQYLVASARPPQALRDPARLPPTGDCGLQAVVCDGSPARLVELGWSRAAASPPPQLYVLMSLQR
jgi:hypothetical protein